MKSRAIGLAVAALLALGVALWMASAPSPTPAGLQNANPSPVVDATPERLGDPGNSEGARATEGSGAPKAAADRRARADALRRRILERRPPDPAGAAERDEDARESGAATGGLTDRIGGRDDLLQALNTDFLPLADECIQAAVERDPELQGTLGIGIEVVGDPELGAVIEGVEFGERNEIDDARLRECVRETAYSTILPAPPDGGRDEFVVTLPVNPDEE